MVVAKPHADRVVLHPINWSQFERLLADLGVHSKSLPCLPIYARLGVPEVWRYDQGQLTIYLLQDEK